MEPPSQGPVPASSETLVASLSHTPLGIQLVSKGVDCRSMPTISKHRSSLDTLLRSKKSLHRLEMRRVPFDGSGLKMNELNGFDLEQI